MPPKKVLTDDGKASAKKSTKAVVITLPPVQKAQNAVKTAASDRPKRAVRQDSNVAYPPMFLDAANKSFADPPGAPQDGRGCEQASVTLMPYKGLWPQSKSQTFSLPKALKDVMQKYPEYSFISGHVMNAEFNGDGNDPANQTCIHSKANRDHKFDDTIKDAWRLLKEIYRVVRKHGVTDANYLKNLGWGIKITGTVDQATWGKGYPENCIATGLTYNAVVVKPQTAASLAANMAEAGEDVKADLTKRITKMESLVSSVNGHYVNNSDYLNLVAVRAPQASWWLEANGQKIDLQAGDTQIGRSSLPGASKNVSRHHATISVGANQTSQIVASGTNPTLLDGKRLTNGKPYNLDDKSEIKLGDYKVVFRET
jgi:FHA domain